MEGIDADSCVGDLPVWPDTASEDEWCAEDQQRGMPSTWNRRPSTESNLMDISSGSEQINRLALLCPEICHEGVIPSASTTCADTESAQSEVNSQKDDKEASLTVHELLGATPPDDNVEAKARTRRGRTRGYKSGDCGAAQQRCTLKDGITTLMVRNIPKTVTQVQFIEELDRCGFAGKYDYCYAPTQSFKTRQHTGFAFVNFISGKSAQQFVTQWHNTRRFGMQTHVRALDVSPAVVQGREANLAGAGTARVRRIRNCNYRPFVVAVPKIELEDSIEQGGGQMARPAEELPMQSERPLAAKDVVYRDYQPRPAEPVQQGRSHLSRQKGSQGGVPAEVHTKVARKGRQRETKLELKTAVTNAVVNITEAIPRGDLQPCFVGPAHGLVAPREQLAQGPQAEVLVKTGSKPCRRNSSKLGREANTSKTSEVEDTEVPPVPPPPLMDTIPLDAARKHIVSWGSLGHPLTCGERCKFVGKPRGCKDGALCDHCHLCAFSANHVQRQERRLGNRTRLDIKEQS
mmetsp:Transcript_50792/g.128072  ORF Transcript_50792/g.128072 Transcript_50792/m.128072 type:complete len:518 (-) Transcript_50792:234-1787(-)